jgi:phosphonatase-like hydrolase
MGTVFSVNPPVGRLLKSLLPMSTIKLVIFDIAGTIIVDRGEVLHAFSTALRKHGVNFPEFELEEWKGASKHKVIEHFVTRQFGDGPNHRQKVAAVYEDFRRALESHYLNDGVLPIAGAGQTFDWVRQHGIQMATTTGFSREVSELVLKKAGWSKLFASKISSSDVCLGRPAPYMIFRAMEATGVLSVEEVVNVGDTPLDLQAGMNAGVRGVIGVLTGFHGKERLEREPHTQLLPSIADLPALIEKEYS